MLVLHPEVAAQKVLPSIPATGIHEPVLESDWARRTRTVVAADGRTVEIASLWQHVVWKRLAELLARCTPMSAAAPPATGPAGAPRRRARAPRGLSVVSPQPCFNAPSAQRER